MEKFSMGPGPGSFYLYPGWSASKRQIVLGNEWCGLHSWKTFKTKVQVISRHFLSLVEASCRWVSRTLDSSSHFAFPTHPSYLTYPQELCYLDEVLSLSFLLYKIGWLGWMINKIISRSTLVVISSYFYYYQDTFTLLIIFRQEAKHRVELVFW